MTTSPAPISAQPYASAVSSIEVLEARIAPAVASPGVYTYTDASGDTVKVQVSGKFTSVDFLTATATDVLAGGGDIKSIVVTGAGSDFALTFAETNPGVGDDTVELGVISGPAGASLPVIKGVATVDSIEGVTFELEGFKGKGFSAGGGLKISGELTGSTDGSGGLEIGTIRGGTSVYFRDGIALGANAVISGKVNGAFATDGEVAGTVFLGSVGKTGLLDLGALSNEVTVERSVAGRILVDETVSEGGEPLGRIHVKGAVLPSSQVLASGAVSLQGDGNVSGLIRAEGDILLSVGKNLTGLDLVGGADLRLGVVGGVTKSAILVRGGLTELNSVGGDIRASSIATTTDLNLTVGEDIVGSRIASSGDGDIVVIGKVSSAVLNAGADLTLSVRKDVVDSEILPDGNLAVQINGAVKLSQIGSRSASLEATVTGKVSRSALLAGDEANIETGDDWVENSLISDSNALISVQGKVSKSDFVSGSNLTVTTGGKFSNSQLLPANDLELTVLNEGVSNSRLETSDGDISVTAAKRIQKTLITAGNSASVSTQGAIRSDVSVQAGIDASVNAAKQIAAAIAAGRDVTVSSADDFRGAIQAAGNLAASVARFAPAPSVSSSLATAVALIRPGVSIAGDLSLHTTGNVVARLIDVGGDVTMLSVGGGFNAVLRVGGDLAPGESNGTVTLVAGAVSARSSIEIGGNIGSPDSAGKLVFSEDFNGRLKVEGGLQTDLQFDGSVSRILVNGAIGAAALGDGIAQIIVNGNVGKISSGSLFARSGAGSGNFVDGAGVITGVLQATGQAADVTPTVFGDSVPNLEPL